MGHIGSVLAEHILDSSESYYPAFLSPKEKISTLEEWKKISSQITAPNFLAEKVLEYAQEKSDDSDIPEALHRVVKATRYGCVDSKSSEYSKKAYTLLHKKFPTNEWTNKTKYWF